MPNWCDNSLHLRHADKAKIDALVEELNKKSDAQLFQRIRPCPPDVDAYAWHMYMWGTKWEADIHDFDQDDDNHASGCSRHAFVHGLLCWTLSGASEYAHTAVSVVV